MSPRNTPPVSVRCSKVSISFPFLVHLTDQRIDIVFTVAKVAAFHKVLELPLVEATVGVVQLKWPEEIGGLFEVGPNGVDWLQVSACIYRVAVSRSRTLVDQVFHANDAVLSELFLDQLVVGEWNALFIDLAVASLCT